MWAALSSCAGTTPLLIRSRSATPPLSVQVLFGEGRIRDYMDDPAEDALLCTAVEWHSAFRLPEKLDARTRTFSQLLRDADKIDILRVNVETPLEEIYNVSTVALRQSPVTPAVLDAFYEHHCVLHSLKKVPRRQRGRPRLARV